jgi:hypothetical protein
MGAAPRHVAMNSPFGGIRRDREEEITIDKWRQIETKFDSSCFIDGKPLRRGSKCWWKKGERVRCDDCVPENERFVTIYDERDMHARRRRDAFLEVFVWKYRDPDEEAKPLLKELKGARLADEIHGLIDEIVEVAVPVKE